MSISLLLLIKRALGKTKRDIGKIKRDIGKTKRGIVSSISMRDDIECRFDFRQTLLYKEEAREQCLVLLLFVDKTFFQKLYEVHAALYEQRESLTLEKTGLKEGKVDELGNERTLFRLFG